jgi:hypothetical protein
MSTKSKILAAATTLTIAAGVGAATTTTVQAATPQCGSKCLLVFSRRFGTAEAPNYAESARYGVAKVGQPTMLYHAVGWNRAEDLMVPRGGTVSDFFASGLVSAAVNEHYSTLRAVQIEYAPLGRPSGLCAAVAKTAFQNEGLTLQRCSAGARTVWIIDPAVSPAPGYFALINGSNRDFVHPIAMTYDGDATKRPEQIRVKHLRLSTAHGATRATVPDTQLWGSALGVVK